MVANPVEVLAEAAAPLVGRLDAPSRPPRSGERLAVELGARIRALRLERGLSQSDLAGDRLSKGFISQVESGRSRPSGDSLAFIAERLAVSVSALLGDEPEDHGARFLTRAVEAALREHRLDDAAALLPRLETMPDADLGVVHLLHGQMLEESGRFDEALEATARAVATARTAETVVRAWNQAGRIQFATGRQVEALQAADRAVEAAADPSVAPALRSQVMVNQARGHIVLGHLARAVIILEDALAAAVESENLEEAAYVELTLGVVARRRGQPDDAVVHGNRAHVLFDRLGLRPLADTALSNVGEAYLDAGMADRAFSAYERALQLSIEAADREGMMLAMEGFARVSLAQGDAVAARARGNAAEAFAVRVGDGCHAALSLMTVAEACSEMGDRAGCDDALERMRRAIAGAGPNPHLDVREVRRSLLLREAEVLRRRGDLRSACSLFERAASAPQAG